MKFLLASLFTGIFAFFGLCASAQVNTSSGIWQTFGEPYSISQVPESRGRLCNFLWKDLEPSPGVWKWTAFDNDLQQRTKDGLPVIFMVYTKEDAPDWLYNNGVPKVAETDAKGNVIGHSPYFADADYKFYFKRMIAKVQEHVETLSASVRAGIIGVQGCFGSTGDYIGYKGEVPNQYYLSGYDFYDLFKEFTQYYYDEYKDTRPKITLLSNPHNNGEDQTTWLVQNCPGGWLKCGSIGKGYQLNDEKNKSNWLYDILNKPSNGSYIRARSELSGNNLDAGWWKEASSKSMFALMCYDIYWGLDWSNQGGSQLTDDLYDSTFRFFNKYAGQKDPTKSTNAMCALKDGLDASNSVRFSPELFGTVSRNNTLRYQNIANAFAGYGARLEDPKTATLMEMDNLSAKGINDVGWDILPGNYERYLHQILPNVTSAGYWNVQSDNPNSRYGKFARGFDVLNDKKALYFDVENAFLSDAPLNGNYAVTIEITYLDNGGGGWQLYYDGKNSSNAASIQVICGNTNTWKKATVTLNNAYFNNRGTNSSDFSIKSTNNKNVIFSIVELSRPKNFASSSSFASTITTDQSALITHQSSTDLVISPNPVINDFSVQLKDNSAITQVVVYNQAGQLLLQRKTSGTRIFISKNEIGNTAGVYYIKVFSGISSYISKFVVL